MLKVNANNFKAKIIEQQKKFFTIDNDFERQIENSIIIPLVDKAKKNAPFWKGVLKRSGRHIIETVTKDMIKGKILFGGYSARYANAMEHGPKKGHKMGQNVIEYNLALWVQDKILKGRSRKKQTTNIKTNKKEVIDRYGITNEAKSIAWAIYKGGINQNGLKARNFVKNAVEEMQKKLNERFKKLVNRKLNNVIRGL
jgi:hypothetical protein